MYHFVAVKPLVVSAGDNHEIRLPTDSITLYAFVLDGESGGGFFFNLNFNLNTWLKWSIFA